MIASVLPKLKIQITKIHGLIKTTLKTKIKQKMVRIADIVYTKRSSRTCMFLPNSQQNMYLNTLLSVHKKQEVRQNFINHFI